MPNDFTVEVVVDERTGVETATVRFDKPSKKTKSKKTKDTPSQDSE